MNTDFPKALEATRDLLAGSLHLHANEQAPGLPGDLHTDLVRRFNFTESTSAPLPSRSWLAVVQSFMARSAFGMAALAVVILGVSAPSLMRTKSTPVSGSFRGAVTAPVKSGGLSIVLIQAPSGIQASLEKSGNFEKGIISCSLSGTTNTDGPRIVVDFTNSSISALNASSEQVYSAPLPADSAELSDAIATAVSRL